MSAIRLALALLPLLACAACQRRPPAHIDHVILGVSDLDQAMNDIERATGVRPAIGGAHPGAGTRNALLSLGDETYLEIYAPNPAEPIASADIAELKSLKRPTPLGWAASTNDQEALAAALKMSGISLSAPEPGSRRKPDGTILRWVTFGFANLDHPLAPFFIVWTDRSLHPARTSPSGCTLQSLAITDSAADQLRRAIDPLQVPVTIALGAKSGITFTLACPRGTITYG